MDYDPQHRIYIKGWTKDTCIPPAGGRQTPAEHRAVFGKVVLDSRRMYAIIRRNQEGRPYERHRMPKDRSHEQQWMPGGECCLVL